MKEQIIVSDLATEGDYDVLRRLSVGKKCVFEFGSFIGGSALAMLPQIKAAGGRLYCVDHFLGNKDDPHTKVVPRDLMVGTLLQRIDPYYEIVTVLVGETKKLGFSHRGSPIWFSLMLRIRVKMLKRIFELRFI